MRQPARELLVKRINWWFYPLALAPIILVFLASAYGYLPFYFGLGALFFLIFWVFSLLFAVYSLFRKPPREPRQ